MDYESAKAVFPVVGGLLALAGGVFTFVNGRLNEAKTPEGRTTVVDATISGIAIALNVVAFVAVVLGEFLIPTGLFALGFMLNTINFARRSGPVHRSEIIMFGIMCCGITTAVCLGLSFRSINGIADVEGHMVDLLGRLENTTQKLTDDLRRVTDVVTTLTKH